MAIFTRIARLKPKIYDKLQNKGEGNDDENFKTKVQINNVLRLKSE